MQYKCANVVHFPEIITSFNKKKSGDLLFMVVACFLHASRVETAVSGRYLITLTVVIVPSV